MYQEQPFQNGKAEFPIVKDTTPQTHAYITEPHRRSSELARGGASLFIAQRRNSTFPI